MRVALVSTLLAAAAIAAGASARPREQTEPFAGLGAWVSVYDTRAWKDPEGTVAVLAQHGVRTLYLETANDRRPSAIEKPARTARFLSAAHDAGIAVVAWYLPSLVDMRLALRRSLAAVDYVTRDGDAFDGFALDIEATNVRRAAERTARAVALATRVRSAVGDDYPLGAITIAPVGSSPTYWPAFPFRALARQVDVLLPMTYFTARTHGAARVATYTTANVTRIRAAVGDPAFPIHPIGGTATAATAAEVRAFVAAAAASTSIGSSLWEYGLMQPRHWRALAPR